MRSHGALLVRMFMPLAALLPIGLAAATAADGGLARNSVDPPAPIELSGEWQLLAGHSTDLVADEPDKFSGWQKTSVPGTWSNGQLDCAWELTRFTAPAAAEGLGCEILFERVHWNAQVFLNGRKLGGSADGYAPFRVLAGDALRPGAENVVVVRVGGYAEVPKSKSGKTLFPAGFAMSGRGGGGGIMGRVFVRFFNKVRLTRVQVIPALDKSIANVRVRVEGAAAEAAVTLTVRELGIGADRTGGPEAGAVSATVRLNDGVGEATVPIGIKDVKPWEPTRPFLYRMEATVQVDEVIADRASERFGMRSVACRPDGFYLNGRKCRLLGTNIIGDMGYWRGAPNLIGRDRIKAAIVEPARAMNAVCIRTHTAPIPKWWLDVCDEEGLLVLLEFPVTVNCADLKFDEAEFVQFGRNLEDEASAIVPYLANHPSIVMWVMTNESNNWPQWEQTALWQHFKNLDPSRPAIRAAYETPDARDVHSYAATWKGSHGDFEFRCRKAAEMAAREKIPAMVSEYLDGMDPRVTRKWFGPAADGVDPKSGERLAAETADFHASRAMEQTEAARRLGYACILPFGPGFYGVFGDRTPRPIDYAVPCALAPVGVSINLDNQHFVAGRKYHATLWVMNDTDAKVSTEVQFRLFNSDPGWNPATIAARAISSSTFDVNVEPHATVTREVEWTAPATEGKYYLLARIEPPSGKPVISRRVVFAIKREPAPKSLAGRKVLVLETGGRRLSEWIAKAGCRLIDPALIGQPSAARGQLPAALAGTDLVVIGPRAAGSEAFKTLSAQLPGYVQRGGRVVVLEQVDWPKLKDLFGIAIERTDYDYDDNNAPADERTDSMMARVSEEQASGGSSRVFRWEQTDRAIWKGIIDEYLYRWNGRHGRVARVAMSDLPGRARVLVKYAEAERDDLKYVPVAAVGHVQGEVLYFMLEVAGRYDPADPDYDPVVERLMINLLQY